MTKFFAGGPRKPTAVLAMALLIGMANTTASAEDEPTKPAPRNMETPMFDQAPMSDGELATTTGRENSTWMNASANNSAVVANNNVGQNSRTGDVNVTDSAFQNVSGISMVNFNSGNNSSINAAMSINLQINYAQPTTMP